MRRETTITALLGVKQRDMAMLLGVHPSQWSMFECGKRDLPPGITQVLADMLVHVQSPDTTAKQKDTLHLSHKAHEELAQLLRENEYRQLLVARKIAALVKKAAADARLARLVDFLAQRTTTKEMRSAHHDHLAHRTTQASDGDKNLALFKHQLQQEVLELENLVIQSKLRKINKTLENTEENN